MLKRAFKAADGQMSGQMSIQLTYLYRAFHALSIDMSHDQKHIFLIFAVVTPPGGGDTGRPRPISVHNMKILVRTNVNVENQLLISFSVDMLP